MVIYSVVRVFDLLPLLASSMFRELDAPFFLIPGG